MKVLAMHSATACCAVALWCDGVITAHQSVAMDRGQAEALVPMIGETMRAAKAGYTDLDRLAVTVGPGTFTGMRIGLATARGLALATGLPLVGVTTLEALAYAADPEDVADGALLAAIETKRADLYVQCFADRTTPFSEPAAIAPDDLADWVGRRPHVVIGDAAVRATAALGAAGVEARLSAAAAEPDARVVAAIAAARPVAAGDPPPRPLYLGAALATPPTPNPRQAP